MPISKTIGVAYVMAPVTFNVDGSIHLVLAGKIVSDDQTNGTAIYSANLTVPAPDVATIMAAVPDGTKNRIDDLTSALYQYLQANGLAPTGLVT